MACAYRHFMTIIALVATFIFITVSGSSRSVEVGCQNSLLKTIKDFRICAVISFGVALIGFSIFLGISVLVSHHSPWPAPAAFAHMPWWSPLGELIGAVSVLSIITVSRYVGVAMFGALLITSEMIVALFLDNFGLMGFIQRHTGPPRLLACALVIAAVSLIAKDAPAPEIPVSTDDTREPPTAVGAV